VPRNSRLLRAIELPDHQDIALASLIEKAMQFGSVPATNENGVPDGVKAAKTAQLIIPSSVALAVEHRTALYTRLRTAQALPAAPTNGNRTNCPRAAVQNLRPGFARSPRALAMSDDKAKTKKGNVKW
jgi:hypothetical protein